MRGAMFFSLDPGFYFQTKQNSIYFGTSKIIFFLSNFYQDSCSELQYRIIDFWIFQVKIFYIKLADRIRKKPYPNILPPQRLNGLFIIHWRLLPFISSNFSLNPELKHLDFLPSMDMILYLYMTSFVFLFCLFSCQTSLYLPLLIDTICHEHLVNTRIYQFAYGLMLGCKIQS